MGKHIADAEGTFQVVNVSPDWCRVNGDIVAYEIEQVMSPEKMGFAHNVLARGGKVLMQGSIIAGVTGNAGEGKESGVALDTGHTLMLEGDDRFLVNGNATCRHGDRCLMNVKVG